jgi:CheY-like chemotaxis protein
VVIAVATEKSDVKTDGTFKYRILFVDDDENIRAMAHLLLEAQGYKVLSAADGFEGLAALRQSLPDVIISDLRMPNMNGFEFLSVVRRRFPHIPAIAISGEFSGMEVPESVLADAFFEKGQYSPKELFQRIIGLLEEVPARPRVGSPPKSAVWIPVNSKANYIAVTCPSCLRTFPVPIPLPAGVNTTQCDFCDTEVSFQITADFRTRGAS